MIREKKKGMWLGLAQNPAKSGSGWMIHTVSALLIYSVCILVFMELTGFSRMCDYWKVLLPGIGICLVYGILLKFQKQNWCLFLVLLVLLVILLFFREQTLEGVRLFWNQMGDVWTEKTGWMLPKLKRQLEMQEHAWCLMLFSIVLSVTCGFLCCLLVGRKWPFASILLPGISLFGMFWFVCDGTFRYLPLILVISVFLLICSGWEKKQMPWLTFGVWFLLLTVGYLLTAVNAFEQVEEWAAGFSETVHENLHVYRFETEDTTLPEGKLKTFEERDSEEEARTALVVTMEQPEEMYLRGYTGTVFEEDTWSVMDTQKLAEEKELLYWLNSQEFDVRTQFASAAGEDAQEKNFVTVQNVGACSNYYYVPFSLASADWLSEENLSPDTLLAEGERNYGFSAVSGSAEKISQIVEYLQNSEEEDALNYRKAESAYREFVYSNYLQISESVQTSLEEYWNLLAQQYGENPQELTVEEAQNCVRSFLEECFGEGESVAKGFLPLQNLAGSDFQYATTVIMTLRHFGFPARYAEGYVITKAMVSDAEEGSAIKVDSSHATAWAEVYQQGVGWVPLELTASVNENAGEENQQNTGKSKKGVSAGKTKKTEKEEIQKEVPEETTDNMRMPLPDMSDPHNLWIVFAVLLLLLLLLVIRRKRILKRKNAKFSQENQREAVAFVFADSAMFLEKLGFDRGNGSMWNLQEPIRERYGEEYAHSFDEMVALNARAVFSSKAMTEEQREAVLKFHGVTLQHLKKEIRWNKRLWMKWIQCLY